MTNELPTTMRAMVTEGHGGIDKIVLHEDWPRPEPAAGEVLIRVGACGLNNTDVNTRSGWYSKAVSDATTGDAFDTVDTDDPTWGGNPIVFPRIQGADVCGKIVAVGKGVDTARIGERVITDNWLRDPEDPSNMDKIGYFGSECHGGYAEYTVIPSSNALAVTSSFSDAELATFSCSYSTAEGMLHRAAVTDNDTVLVTGASGGVGSALIQLAKLRGARVLAVSSPEKFDSLLALGADQVFPRDISTAVDALASERVTVVADVVGGSLWHQLIDVLERGGRYVCSGAIAGPIVEFDLRTFYLRHLVLLGSTVIPPAVTANLIRYIESKAIRPVLAASYPLEQLREAQTAFIAKAHTGNIVVIP